MNGASHLNFKITANVLTVKGVSKLLKIKTQTGVFAVVVVVAVVAVVVVVAVVAVVAVVVVALMVKLTRNMMVIKDTLDKEVVKDKGITTQAIATKPKGPTLVATDLKANTFALTEDLASQKPTLMATKFPLSKGSLASLDVMLKVALKKK